MAFYTFFGVKGHNTGSRIVFSTGRDMIIGEQLDLNTQETTELAKVANHYDVRAGQLTPTINHLTFPAVRYYVRGFNGQAVTKKPYQK